MFSQPKCILFIQVCNLRLLVHVPLPLHDGLFTDFNWHCVSF